MYKHIEPDDDLRKKLLPIFFKNYLKLMYDYSDILSLDNRLEEVSLWYYSSRCKSINRYKIQSLICIFKSLEMCKYISIKEFKRKLSIINKMSSAWIDDLNLKEYIHLDMLTVKKEKRGTGLTRILMEKMMQEIDSKGLACTIETQNIDNILIYEKFGFKVIGKIPLEHSEVVQYCLIRKACR